MEKTTILFLSADPSDTAKSRLKKEKNNIKEKLQLAKMQDKFVLDERTSVRPGELTQAIHDVGPQILHFAGYGESTGELCLENEDGEIHKVQPDALASLFELIAEQVRCVVLNACYSEITAEVIAKHIDYVIGMSGEISDEAAITFAVGFYKALGGGRLYEEAYHFGLVELKLLNIPEHLTPVILGKKIPKLCESEPCISEPNISALVTPLSEFLERSVLEGPQGIPFTWLIGAGMSVTSGIPLAKDISYRIILFEYITRKKRVRPWAPENQKRITYDTDLTDFFEWYEEGANVQGQEFVNYRWDSINWLKNEKKYKDISLDDPKCYQWLFQNVFLSTTLHHAFLTNLVNRTKGVNLAHLGLAGLLRDHPEWGHTVFTTNFDDLLLTALLSLNHTARVFGDLQSADKPHANPDYPQIVHLHGRHTGYRLRNTEEQISLIDPELLDGFTKQIANSHLIVLGYSGWDELVINALREWPKQDDLIKGNLIWIPYQNENTLLPQVQEFLNSCPPGRVHVITNEDYSLDADSFILHLCNALNEDDGGFVPYRKGIIDHAKRQHSFVLRQLENNYHEFAPSQALHHIRQAKENLKNGAIKETERLKELAEVLVEADDIPDTLRGDVFLEIGIVELLLGKNDKSEEYLQKALLTWDKIKEYSPKKSQVEKANTLRVFGELYLKLGNLEEAKGYIFGSIRRYERIGENSGIGYAKKLLSDIDMRKGRIQTAEKFLKESLNAFEIDDIYGQAICFRSLGEICRMSGDHDSALKNYEEANRLFSKINNEQGIANTLKGITNVYIRKGDYEKAKDAIDDAMARYQKLGDKLGTANMENSLGDLYLQKGDIQNAIKQYKRSAKSYRDKGAKHGLSNALADILVCWSKSSDIDNADDDVEAIRQELLEVSGLCKNAYALKIAKKQFHHSAEPKIDNDSLVNSQTENPEIDNKESERRVNSQIESPKTENSQVDNNNLTTNLQTNNSQTNNKHLNICLKKKDKPHAGTDDKQKEMSHVSPDRRRGKIPYADIDNVKFRAMKEGTLCYSSFKKATKEFNLLKKNYLVSKKSNLNNVSSVVFWVKGYELTHDEKKKGYVGNFAEVSIENLKSGGWTLFMKKIPEELGSHPWRKPKPDMPMPNMGHPVIRSALKKELFSNEESVQYQLEKLHMRYPETAILIEKNSLYLFIYSKKSTPYAKKYILEVKEDESGKFFLELRENLQAQLPKHKFDEILDTISSYLVIQD